MNSFTVIKFRCGVISGYSDKLFYGPAIYTHQLNCPIHGLEKYEYLETLYFDKTTSISEREKIIQSNLDNYAKKIRMGEV